MNKILLSILLILVISCSKEEKYRSVSFFAMGTYVDITLPEKNSIEFKNVTNLIDKLSFDIKKETDYINNSKSNDEIQISDSYCNLLKKAEYYKKISNGKFNISIYTILHLYGFPEGDFRDISKKEKLEALEISKKGITLVEKNNHCSVINNGAKIDLGSFAKGYIVDEAANYLTKKGINNFIISAGGDLYAGGLKNNNLWRLGIKNPNVKGGISKVVELSNKALATSGTYERFFINKNGDKISHLIDATNGEEPNYYVSVSVIADTAELADAFATIYFLLPPNEVKKRCKNDKTIVYTINKNNVMSEFCN